MRPNRGTLSSIGLAVILVTVAASTVVPPIAEGAPATKASQELAVLVEAHTVVSQPATLSERRTVASAQPITGGQTTLPVLRHAVTKHGVAWLLVMLPGRPNGAQGWIQQRGSLRATTSWRIDVRAASRAPQKIATGRTASR